MQGAEKILVPANLKVTLHWNFVLPRRICLICKQEIFYATPQLSYNEVAVKANL